MQPQPDLTQIQQLPVYHRVTIPPDYLDMMGHLNIRYYVAIYDEAAWGLFQSLSVDLTYVTERRLGTFALTQHIRYLAEVHGGDTVAIHSRLIARSAKRLQFMHFMINETKNVLASTIEVLATHVNLQVRRTTPFPDDIAALIDATLADHQQLGWDAPLCGVIAP